MLYGKSQIIDDMVRHFTKIFRKIHSDNLYWRFELLHRVGKWILPKYRFKWPHMGWWYHERFNDYLEKFDEIAGMNTDRRWMMYQLMRLISAVPGDTAECGAYTGAGSYLISKVNERNAPHHRTHFVFDSFEGVSEPSSIDGNYWAKGDLCCSLDVIRNNLKDCMNISFHKGWIPERFADIEHHRFAFVHIDVDIYQPTLDSIEFFYPRMNQGGIILCDDYAFTSCPGATKAIDEFLRDKHEQMVSLSCGGGFLIKGCETEKQSGLKCL